MFTLLLRIAFLCILGLSTLPAEADTWPSKPVRLVVPYAAGGGVDVLARTFANRLTRLWGQTVLVDNKPGAGGLIAAQAVAHAPADGYTLLAASSSLATSVALSKNPGFDPTRDLLPISMLVESPSLFAVNPQVPAKTVAEFIMLAKASPGKLNYGSTGIGSGPHLAMALFASLVGIDIVHIPYNGDAPMYAALYADQIQATILASQQGMAQVRSGRLVALAVTSGARSPFLPTVPGMDETPAKGFEYKPWIGILAPANVPADIVRKVNADLTSVLNDDEIKSKVIPDWGAQATPGTPDQFNTRYLSDIALYKRLIIESKIPLND